jgi:glycerophosphoryl diester phosphodiesterase
MKNFTLRIALMAVLISALQFLACKATQRKPLENIPNNFDWQGHRGCRGIMPENTVQAFIKALDYPEVTTLELDLAVSKDKQLIVSHEPWFSATICQLPNGDSIPHTAETRHLIYERTVAEIRDYDCGSRPNPRFPQQERMRAYKPTLREVVEAVRQHLGNQRTIRWNIEIKSAPDYDGYKTPPIAEFVEIVIKEVRALGIEKSCTLQSFDTRPLIILHQKAPELQLAYLIENTAPMEDNMAKLGFVPQIYSPYYLMVDKKLVQKCHDRGMKIIPWTVNDVTAMRQLIQLGVDGIITDYPNKIREVGK